MHRQNHKLPKIIAHRGGAGEVPENTDVALAYANVLGVESFETDLRCSKDGTVFLQHDAEVGEFFNPVYSKAASGGNSKQELTQESQIIHPQRITKDENSFPVTKILAKCRKRFLFPGNLFLKHKTLEPNTKLFKDLTFAEISALSAPVKPEIQKILKSSSQRFSTPTAHPITLKEALEQYPHLAFNLDIKEPAALSKSLRIVAQQQAWDRVTWASFSNRILKQIRRHPEANTALSPAEVLRFKIAITIMKLLRLDKRKKYSGKMPDILQKFVNLPPQAKALQIPEKIYGIKLLDSLSVQIAQNLNLRVEPWTINTIPQAQKLIDLGVDGIITDHPKTLIELLESKV